MKNIIIAGATGSLGKYFVKEYLNLGFFVISISRKKLKIKNKRFLNYNLELSNKTETENFYKSIIKKKKNISFILSCVGKSNYNKDKNVWHKSINDNLISNINLVEEYVNIYKNYSSNTKIILISSIAGIKAIKAPISYSISKNALNFYCKLKAKKLSSKNILINSISPGNILMKENVWDKKIKVNKKKVLKYIKLNVPLNNFCKPEHIKKLCDYIFSDSGNFITGSNFIIDGGQTANV